MILKYIHPRSSHLVVLDKPLPVSGLLLPCFYLTPIFWYYYLWSERDCLWPWELVHFWQWRLNHKPCVCVLCNLRVNICSWIALYLWLQVLQRFQTAKVTFKLTQDHWHSCHSIAHTWFPIRLCLSCTISEILSLISPNLKISHDHDYSHAMDSL